MCPFLPPSIALTRRNCKAPASEPAIVNSQLSVLHGGKKRRGEALLPPGGWIHFLRRPRRPSMLRLRSAIRPSEAVMNCLSLSSKI